MARKLTNNGKPQSSGITTIGLDIGFGVTKVVTSNGSFSFPSVAGYAREIKFNAAEIAKKYPGDQITDDDGAEWFVGDLALSQLKPHEQRRLRGRTANEADMGNVFRVRFAKVAIGKLFAGSHNGDVMHLRIATGLPVDHMRDAGELKAALIGQHRIKTDVCDIIANITEVMVMPQPYGTIYGQMLTQAGEINPCHTATRTGVVDIGTYTIDLALDDDGEYIDGESGSIEGGVYTAQERISDVFESTYREKPRYKTVETILRTGCARVGEQTVNFQDDVETALQPLRAATLNLMGDKWQVGKSVDVIYLAGGGAELVFDAVKAAYPQAHLVEDAQFSNARGYLNYAHFRALEQ